MIESDRHTFKACAKKIHNLVKAITAVTNPKKIGLAQQCSQMSLRSSSLGYLIEKFTENLRIETTWQPGPDSVKRVPYTTQNHKITTGQPVQL
jgi:hypothetical protein